jgi:N,N'-diacetyllegionaminate synthase
MRSAGAGYRHLAVRSLLPCGNSVLSSTFAISGRPVGGAAPTYLIAEVAQAHDGSLGTAQAFIDAAADAGADAVKFQTHIAAAESTRDEPFRVKFSDQDSTRLEYWRRMEFSPEHWAGLAGHARARDLHFLSSAFSLEAVELLRNLDVPAWKVASGEVCSDGRPVLLSTGMSPWADIDLAVARIRQAGAPVAVLQCVSRYPTPLADVALNVIDEMRARYDSPAGLSDHSGQPWPALAAISRGAAIIELHITLSDRMFGPDVPSSLTVEQFRMVADLRDAVAVMDAHPGDKDAVAEELSDMRAMFGRSLAPKTNLRAGTLITEDMLVAKKPATGIPVGDSEAVIGRILVRDVPSDRLIAWDDLHVDG